MLGQQGGRCPPCGSSAGEHSTRFLRIHSSYSNSACHNFFQFFKRALMMKDLRLRSHSSGFSVYQVLHLGQRGDHHKNSLQPTFFMQFAQLRSEEHTSELQSRGHLVCRLLLEKKKRNASTAAHV